MRWGDDVSENFSVSANPLNEYGVLKIINNETIFPVIVNVFDSQGKLLINKVNTNSIIDLDFTSIPIGIYTLQVADIKSVFCKWIIVK